MSRLLRFLFLFTLAGSLWAAPFTAFRDGESFTYRVGFAIFNRAGDLVITAHDDTLEGKPVVRIANAINSRGIVRGFYAFDNKSEVVIERKTGRLLSVRETGADPKRATDTELTIDYDRRVAHYVDRVRTERSAEVALPEGDPIDLISALVQTRDWNLKPGEKRDVLVEFGKEFYPISIYAERYEEVRTPLGKFNTLVLVPRMEKDPKGLFKRGGEIKVWIAQDDVNKLPVRMQLKLNYGTALLVLSEYKTGEIKPPADPTK